MTKASGRQSLSDKYHGHPEVPLLIFISAGLLVVGLSVPLMKIEKFVFWKNDYSVFTGVIGLIADKQILLAAVVFFFSMLFPFVKLTALLVVWWARLKNADRKKLLHWLGILGKWSMLDVFAVSILIVLVKLGPLASIEPQPGLYFFCGAILFSMATAMYIDHLAKSKFSNSD
jgi:paraquat-inducible protein A